MWKKVIYVQEDGTPDSSRQIFLLQSKMSWKQVLIEIQQILKMENIEGLYDKDGYQYWRMESIPRDSVVYARLSEMDCLVHDLSLSEKECQDVEKSAWDVVERSRKAKAHLKEIVQIEEYEKMKQMISPSLPNSSSSSISSKGKLELMKTMNKAREEGLSSILKELNSNKDNLHIQLAGLRLLGEICSKMNSKHNDQFISLEGLTCIFNCMEIFSKDLEIIRRSLWIIILLIEKISECDPTLEWHVLTKVADLFSKTNDLIIGKHCMIIIARALDTSESICRINYEEMDLFNSLFRIMDIFEDEDDIHSYALWVWKSMLIDCEIPIQSQEIFTKVIKYIEASRTRFYFNDQLQKACQFCIHILQDEKYPHLKTKKSISDGRSKGTLY